MVQPKTNLQPVPVLIAGPTASGKSSLALDIADRVGGVIINADALQVYANWRVLSARPDASDLSRHCHRLYGHVEPQRAYSVGDWLADMEREIASARAQEQRLIIVGGTGLYLSALTTGISPIPPIPDDIRQAGDRMRQEGGAGSFIAELHMDDPIGLERIDQRNPARLQRAWEVLRATGKPLHHWQANRHPPLVPLASAMALCLHAPPDWLNARIEGRFATMVKTGALDECRDWQRLGLSFDLPSGKAIGVRELCGYLDGRLGLDEAMEQAQIATRQYAKRQRTWFRSRMADWIGLDVSLDRPVDRIVADICERDTQSAN